MCHNGTILRVPLRLLEIHIKNKKTHYEILDKSHNAQDKSLKMLKNHKNKYEKLDKMNILFSFRRNAKCQNFWMSRNGIVVLVF